MLWETHRVAAATGGSDAKEGEAAVATASGMTAILALCLTHLKAGDHLLCSRDVFGATVGLFQNTL